MTASAESSSRSKILAPYMALAALWIFTITVVPPRGNFPLNDDWMYAKVVQHLVETGEYQPTPYADPTFILQAYWGAAFAKLFGFSFETLRLSTLVLALVAIWAAHWAAREAGLNARWAFLVALTLLVNPLFLNLSYTFMTDVPFLAVSTLSIAAFLRFYRTSRFRWLIIASSVAATGYFIRQFTLLVPLAFAATLVVIQTRNVLTKQPMDDPKQTARNLAALVVPWLAAFVLMRVLPIGGEGLGAWNWNDLGSTFTARALTVLKFSACALTYLALFIAPILAVNRPAHSPTGSPSPFPRVFPVTCVLIAITLLVMTSRYFRPPNLGNLLYDFGVGPLLLPGMIEYDHIAAPVRIGSAWIVITIVGVIGASMIAHIGLVTIRRAVTNHTGDNRRVEPVDLFLVCLAGAFIVVLILPAVQARFDRYLLSAMLPISIGCARYIAPNVRAKWFLIPAGVTATLLYLFGLACLQDYLAWNDARWKALNSLQDKHAAPLDQINGGYEFNGWFHSDTYAEESRSTGKKIFGPKGWWIRGDDYRVSLRAPQSFRVIGREMYFSMLGWEQGEILLLERTGPDETF